MAERNAGPEIIVVGGGHAGAEAAAAAARLGARCTLLTLDPGAVGRMSCNPSIGGLAKGQIVREVDALGGIMGRVADRTAIHFRLLNRRKGPAVQSPRTQNDRLLYERAVRRELEQAGVSVRTGEVVNLLVAGERVRGVVLGDGRRLEADAVVLTTGTFLGGVLHVGEESRAGGRMGEGASHGLSHRLAAFGFRLGRLKTGTPPRLLARSIAWDRCEEQPSDEDPVRFSFTGVELLRERRSCAITRTTPAVHDLIRENLDRSPLFSGRIRGTGPRYCPSIEDKIFRFPGKESHQVFLEPEGLESELVYPNGISTSLPVDVQEAFVRSIPALEEAEFAAFGYAVEYDHVDPTECDPSLETQRLKRLFLAGQINGTTGYEEAAGQGLLAGINAVFAARGEAPLVLGRHEAYVGVLVDDLVTKGVSEPYRMFTSLAEHRLLLRHHDADVRLLDHALRLGLHEEGFLERTRLRRERRERARRILSTRRRGSRTLWESLRSPGTNLAEVLAGLPEAADLDLDARDLDELGMEAAYGGYVERERAWVEKQRAAEDRLLPPDLDYHAVPQLRHEAREKFSRVRPRTLGQAGRIPGISPADLAVLLVHLKAASRTAG